MAIRFRSGFCIALWLAASTLVFAAAPSSVIKIDTGIIEGSTEAGVISWKGIAFAAPPIGDLRWRAPQPAAAWSGVKATVAYRNDCMQLPFPSDAAPLGTPPAEDCLYANVWRPAVAKAKLPVLVWIYGGGFVNGGASPPTYSGAHMATRGVAFVSFNYRLGRFGAFAHPQLTRENADDGMLGNYGYMDQLAALRWVQRNIAAFGGDPGNVTIIGESAGGRSVHVLVTSPLAKGLFHRAVVMSGGDGGGFGGDPSLRAAEAIGVTFAQSKGITADDAQALKKLRALPAGQLVDGLNLASMNPPGPRSYGGPFEDGKLAVDSLAAYRAGKFQQVPIMIGATDADMGGQTGGMIAGAHRISALIAERGVPVYAYRFSYVAESIGQPGAKHASDIPYFFDNAAIKYGSATTPKDVAMGKAIATYIVNFATRGDPNGAGLPAWPRYGRATDEIMDFAASGVPHPGKDPWGTLLDRAAEALPK